MSIMLTQKNKLMSNKNIHVIRFLGTYCWVLSSAFLMIESVNASSEFSASLTTSAMFDSEVGVDEIDTITGKSDTAYTLQPKIKGRVINDNVSVSGSYSYKMTDYSMFDEFNLSAHSASLTPKIKINDMDYSLRLDYVKTQLDGDKFLDLTLANFSIQKIFNMRTAIRLSVGQGDKVFHIDNERNAKTYSLGLDTYRFSRNAESYVAASINYSQDNAYIDEHSYQQSTMNIYGAYTFSESAITLKTGFEYYQRPYDGTTEVASQYISEDNESPFSNVTGNGNNGSNESNENYIYAEQRKDNKYKIYAALESALYKNILLDVNISLSHTESNIAVYDQTEYGAIVGLTYTLK